MIKTLKSVGVGIVFLLLAGCGGGGENTASVAEETGPPAAQTLTREFTLPQMDDESFARLSPDDRVYVAKKLYTTLYKGRSLERLENEIRERGFMSRLRARLHTQGAKADEAKIYEDTYRIPYDSRAGDRLFEKRWRIFARIASRLYYTPLGKEYFDAWIAYVLSQTILFSPAYEVESVTPFPELIGSNYDRLRTALTRGDPIRKLVFDHMRSKENWARFRSPEDNGREMLEIWLYDYEDAHVPLAARALRNWGWEVHREKNASGIYGTVYHFRNDISDPEEINDEPVEILGRTVTTGTDFYRMIADHPQLIPTVVDRLVNHFFPTFDAEKKAALTRQILASDPTTFQEVFEQILFSKAYLLESDRIKSAEEVYFPLAQQLDITPDGTSFRYFMTRGMEPSHQAPFVYKLGRLDEGESDTDSVVRFHQYIRSYIFLNRRKDGWSSSALTARYDADTLEKLLDNMFLDVVGRKATEDERQTLSAIVADAGLDVDHLRAWDRFAVLLMTYDYFARLSEIYTYRKVQGGTR